MPTNDERVETQQRLNAIGIFLYGSVQNDPDSEWEDDDLEAFEAAIAAYEREPELGAEIWQRNEALAQIARLRAALEKRTGWLHDFECSMRSSTCSCGLVEAVRVLIETKGSDDGE